MRILNIREITLTITTKINRDLETDLGGWGIDHTIPMVIINIMNKIISLIHQIKARTIITHTPITKSELGKRTQVELESNSMTKLPRPETIDLREDNLFEER